VEARREGFFEVVRKELTLRNYSSKTTEIYTHVTKQSIAAIRSLIDRITISKPTKGVKPRVK